VPALPAAQIEDPVRALQPGAPDQEIDFLLGIAVILDHIAVGFEVKRIEQGTPPFRGQVPLQIGNGAKRTRSTGRLAGDPIGFAAGRMKGFVLWERRYGPGFFPHLLTPAVADMKKGGVR
jgi:hypothetical protein